MAVKVSAILNSKYIIYCQLLFSFCTKSLFDYISVNWVSESVNSLVGPYFTIIFTSIHIMEKTRKLIEDTRGVIREYRRRQECILSLLDQITGLTIITAYVRADRQTDRQE